MKCISLICALFMIVDAQAQMDSIRSASYSWDTTTAGRRHGDAKKLFSGSGAILSAHALIGVTLLKDEPYILYEGTQLERFFIIKNGPVRVKMGDSSAILDRGSIVFVMPYDRAVITALETTAQLYEMSYVSIANPDTERGKAAGSSFWQDWNKIKFNPHDRGGVRQFFNRKTTMLNRFDMHVTTMNPGLKSHEPHTHKNEEIILMLQGNAEMQIGSRHVKANVGDAVYVGSMVLHNLTNTGSVPAIYYAIQWN